MAPVECKKCETASCRELKSGPEVLARMLR